MRPTASEKVRHADPVDAPRQGRRGREDGVELDPSQRAAAEYLAALLDRRGRPRRGSGGIYLHGPPGRGKTMLMDRFFATVRTNRKRRWHFHEFFARLHAAAATTGTVDAAIAGLVGDAELICFDEFHVHDIGDAMLVARLLHALFARRTPLVVTSNYPPDGLLPNPLFHDRFLPAIDSITGTLSVIALDGSRDYRRAPAGAVLGVRASGSAPESGPSDIASGRARDPDHPRDRRVGGVHPARGFASGSYLVDSAPPATGMTTVRVGTRQFTARAAENGTLDTDFAALCGTLLGAADYVALAARFARWIVVDVPGLAGLPPDQVMRWVNLIDVLYDADRTLTVYADVPIGGLATGVGPVAGVADLGRTVSRLYEISHPGAAAAG